MSESLLALGFTLPATADPDRRRQLARLAGRLGYRHVWLPVETPPRPEALHDLGRAAAPARFGVILSDVTEETARWLRDRPEILVEVPVAGPPERRVVAALGGPAAWRRRVYARGPWSPAAGCVVVADDRRRLLRDVTAARDARDRAGLAAPIVAVVAVSIGRTMSEADARARRDPLMDGDRHPRVSGLFGTLQDAQAQVMALARAGADGLRAVLADEQDIADLLAQLRAAAAGPMPYLLARTSQTPSSQTPSSQTSSSQTPSSRKRGE